MDYNMTYFFYLEYFLECLLKSIQDVTEQNVINPVPYKPQVLFLRVLG